jgi:sucrose-6-phosphate hydrolase SacC (GH32 family)
VFGLQSYELGHNESSTSLRVLVDKVVIEVFAGGGLAVATVATNKLGVNATAAELSVSANTGQVELDAQAWSMGCGWVADVNGETATSINTLTVGDAE